MREGTDPAFEQFLIEDVILALGNLRASLAWLMDPGAAAPPAALRAGLERAMLQVAQVEDRARDMCRAVRERNPPMRDPAPAAYVEASGIGLELFLRDALEAEGVSLPAPVFRTRREV
jgi:hypothetical protein